MRLWLTAAELARVALVRALTAVGCVCWLRAGIAHAQEQGRRVSSICIMRGYRLFSVTAAAASVGLRSPVLPARLGFFSYSIKLIDVLGVTLHTRCPVYSSPSLP